MTVQEPSATSDRLLWGWVMAGVALGLWICWAIATERLVLGSHEGRWFYPYVHPVNHWVLAVAALSAVAAAVLLAVARPKSVRGDWLAILMWIGLATGAHAMMRANTPYTLESLFVSDAANAFYGASRQNQPSDVLRRFNRVRQSAPLHAQSNMPGKLLLTSALRMITERTAVLPWLIVVISNLGAALMYLFVRELLGDREAALNSAVLYLFVPGRLLFFPIMNTVTPVVVLACACLLARWLRTGGLLWPMLLGVATYAMMFFEPLPMAMGLAGAGLALAAISQGTITRDRVWLQSAVVVVTLVATVIAIDRWTGFDIVRAFQQIGAHAIEFNAAEERPYWFWVRANLLEFLVCVGGCQAVMVVGAIVHGRSGAGGWRGWFARPIVALSLGLLAVLAVLDLLGVNRGEVVRLWIFLACFLQIPAAYACARLRSRAALMLVVSCSVFEAALGTAMIGFVLP